MTKVGSRPPSASTDATRLVVVVLPCVPAMAMPSLKRMSSASISARGTTGTPRLARGRDLGVVGGDGGRDDHDVGALDVRRRVARMDAHAEAFEPMRHRRGGEVGARHLVALRREDLGDAAHAGAADADEVDVADAALHLAFRHGSKHASATRSVASRRASLRAACAMVSARARSRPDRNPASASFVSSSCAMQVRRPAVDEEARVRGLLVGDRARQRDDERAQAHRGEFADRERAAPGDGDVRPGVARGHVVDERDALGVDARVAIGRLERGQVLRARLVHDERAPPGRQRRERGRHARVEALRAEAAADDEEPQRSLAAGEAFFRRRQRGDRLAQRIAGPGGDLRVPAAHRVGEAQQDPVGAEGEHAVREAGDRVRVVDRELDAARDRHQRAGEGREAAEAEHDVRPPPREDAAARDAGGRERERSGQEGREPLAAHAAERDALRTRRRGAARASTRGPRACRARTRARRAPRAGPRPRGRGTRGRRCRLW